MLSRINDFAKSSKTVSEARKHTGNVSLLKEVALFIGWFIVLMILMEATGLILELIVKNPSNDVSVLLNLLTFLPVPFFIMLLSRKIEKRSLESFGFSPNALLSIAKGLVIGLVMFLAVVALGIISGQYRFAGFDFGCTYLFIPYLLCFAVQSFGEEFYTRGWALTYFSKNHSIITAIIISCIVFILPHMMNNGLNLMAIINLFLFGLVFVVLFLRFDNIWICYGLHTIWNFTQGFLLGFNVSGIETSSIIKFTQASSSIIGGGAFGPESSLIATFVIVIALIVALYYPKE